MILALLQHTRDTDRHQSDAAKNTTCPRCNRAYGEVTRFNVNIHMKLRYREQQHVKTLMSIEKYFSD